MTYINTTFAHGNGPYARCVEWAIAVNDVREEQGLERLSIVVPLVYPKRQQRILKEEIETNVSPDFLDKHPHEILFDRLQGDLLSSLMFKQKDYSDNLEVLVRDYNKTETGINKHLDGKRFVEDFNGGVIQIDLRDCSFQLGLNNRMQTGIERQYYTAGGAGPFDELLERAIRDEEIKHDKDVMKSAIPIAQRMIENQRIIFSNEPGVFSYDESRKLKDNEVYTPCFIHFPKLNNTELPGKGIYLLMTGIDGVRESGMYDAVADLGMQLYAPRFSIEGLPDSIKEKVIALEPSKINNPSIIAQYARAGWSSVWLSHMSEKGFISPPYQETDDPEMLFNKRGIRKLGLGAIIEDDPRKALEESTELASKVGEYNQMLVGKYGTLDGIRYAAEKVVDDLENDFSSI